LRRLGELSKGTPQQSLFRLEIWAIPGTKLTAGSYSGE
jgi:hypothetical protein